jgi:hypothetical protein
MLRDWTLASRFDLWVAAPVFLTRKAAYSQIFWSTDCRGENPCFSGVLDSSEFCRLFRASFRLNMNNPRRPLAPSMVSMRMTDSFARGVCGRRQR